MSKRLVAVTNGNHGPLVVDEMEEACLFTTFLGAVPCIAVGIANCPSSSTCFSLYFFAVVRTDGLDITINRFFARRGVLRRSNC